LGKTAEANADLNALKKARIATHEDATLSGEALLAEIANERELPS
jgi:hypothetical protein